MKSVFQEFKERGFIEQLTHEEELATILNTKKVACYIGFDPTAASLHVGSMIPIMALYHMQQYGHRPIILIGGGTACVGDPSGKTEMRKMMSIEKIEKNAQGIKDQLSKIIDFNEGKALLLNNANWLKDINYINFLRDIGCHFSVNRMIKAESYRNRIDSEEGLSFIEFNYMLLQSYDFLHLFSNYDCILQMGGSDQWGNIVAGIELIRRIKHDGAYGLTFPLITTSNGEKMGKTAQGAIWLDSKLTEPYEFFQYWINTNDNDVMRFLKLFTILPIEEICRIESMIGEELNIVKTILAYEITKFIHGEEEAIKSYKASSMLFNRKKIIESDILPSSSIPRNLNSDSDEMMPCIYIDKSMLENGIMIYKLLSEVGICVSGSEAKRLIQQGGVYIEGKKIGSYEEKVDISSMNNGQLMLRVGKKRYHKIVVR